MKNKLNDVIKNKKNGIVNFDSIILNLMADMVLYYDLSIDYVCLLSEDEIYDFFDNMEYEEDEAFLCNKCSSKIKIENGGSESTYDWNSGFCKKCNEEVFIYYGY